MGAEISDKYYELSQHVRTLTSCSRLMKTLHKIENDNEESSMS